MAMQDSPLLMKYLINRAARLTPDQPVISLTASGVRKSSYREVQRHAHQLAHALTNFGIETGDRVATMLMNHQEHLEAYYTAGCLGVVLHTVNVRLSPEDLIYIINHAEDRVLIIDDFFFPLLAPIVDQLSTVALILLVSEGPSSQDLPQLKGKMIAYYHEYIQDQPEEYLWPDFDERSPLGLCYTSGTTGFPKGVMYEHRSQYLHTLMAAQSDVIGMSVLYSVLLIVPMFHVQAWGVPWMLLMTGAKVVLPSRYMEPERLLQVMDSEKITLSLGVPTIWQGVRDAYLKSGGSYDLSALDFLISGGSASPPDLVRWYLETLNVPIHQGWGMTETSPMATLSKSYYLPSQINDSVEVKVDRLSKAGLLLPGLEIDLLNEEMLSVKGDGAGEIAIKGPWITGSYYATEAEDKFHEGALLTGDIGLFSEFGELEIVDRVKDLIKTGGEWVSSIDLENYILLMAGVSRACVVAQYHPKWQERPVAILVLEEGQSPFELKEVREHCLKKFAKWQLPDDVLYWDDLPLNATGKVNKRQVRSILKDSGYELK